VRSILRWPKSGDPDAEGFIGFDTGAIPFLWRIARTTGTLEGIGSVHA
jgi:hypothetical protein